MNVSPVGSCPCVIAGQERGQVNFDREARRFARRSGVGKTLGTWSGSLPFLLKLFFARADSCAWTRALAASWPAACRVSRTEDTMRLLTFSINVTLDGCVAHQESTADADTTAFFINHLDASVAMLWGRVTYKQKE